MILAGGGGAGADSNWDCKENGASKMKDREGEAESHKKIAANLKLSRDCGGFP